MTVDILGLTLSVKGVASDTDHITVTKIRCSADASVRSQYLPRARIHEGVKKLVLSVCHSVKNVEISTFTRLKMLYAAMT